MWQRDEKTTCLFLYEGCLKIRKSNKQWEKLKIGNCEAVKCEVLRCFMSRTLFSLLCLFFLFVCLGLFVLSGLPTDVVFCPAGCCCCFFFLLSFLVHSAFDVGFLFRHEHRYHMADVCSRETRFLAS